MTGLEDREVKDKDLMKKLSDYTKLEPNERVKKTNKFPDLLEENETNGKGKLSAKDKSEKYGIKIFPVKGYFKAYTIEEPIFIGDKERQIRAHDNVFPVAKKENMLSWLCFYENKNYNEADKLYNSLKNASYGFGFKINEPKWIEMKNYSESKEWINITETLMGKKNNNYNFVVFLIGQNDKYGKLYSQLKKHSLCANGYVSQVVKAETMRKKGVMSICSKILLQINAKLGGYSYKIDDYDYNDKNLMIIGIDSSYIKKKGRGIAMVATINNSYTNFYNKEEIIKENDENEDEKLKQIQLYVSSFIEEALQVYKKLNNDINPQGIIIYRQGVSLQQKKILKIEINQIDELLTKEEIDYYYILVNAKTTFKFFEIEEINKNKRYNRPRSNYKQDDNKRRYYNPEHGLLIIDGVTNKDYFEFYIQPQEVTWGSATPTCFHVAYGNLDFKENIPKLTYDLCFIYSNWQGPVRVPNVLKAAEKLSKMTAKYTFDKLNPNLVLGQAYL